MSTSKLVFILAILLCCPKAGAVAVPGDPVTIEALISLHKMTVDNEKEIRDRLAEMEAIQVVLKLESRKTEDKVEMLHSKLKVFNSWVLLASAMSNLTMEVADLTKEVTKFTSEGAQLMGKDVFVATIYAQAIYKIQKYIKQSIKDMATLGLSNTDILRASMEQRLNIVYHIKGRLEVIENIMSSARWHARWLTGKGFTFYNIEYLVSSDMMQDILKATIKMWTNH